MTDHPYDTLIAQVHEDLNSIAEMDAEVGVARLIGLRNYGEFGLMAMLAEKYLMFRPDHAETLKLHAQALIDSGAPQATTRYLGDVLAQKITDLKEEVELRALSGRAHKDLMVLALGREADTAARYHAQASFDAYMAASARTDPPGYYPLINAAAVADYARAHRVSLTGAPDPVALARQVCDLLGTADTDDPWVHATRAEARIPLGDWDEVDLHLSRYLDMPGVPAFYYNTTHRQFRDLWRLGVQGKRGRIVLASLAAKALWTNKGVTGHQSIDLDPAELEGTEKLLGKDGQKSYDWVMDGCACGHRVAAVLKRDGSRVGTSFVVDAEVLGLAEKAKGQVCMMTNYHVLNTDGNHNALKPSVLPTVRFEKSHFTDLRDEKIAIKDLIFESPLLGGLDCTVFTIDAKRCSDRFAPIPLVPEAVPDMEGAATPRVYILGYPNGGALHFSLQDNHILDHECPDSGTPTKPERRLIHYFAPSEEGNSGSPVFDDGWGCIALHHKGKKLDPSKERSGLPRLNGKEGRYSANQGIWIGSIIAAVKAANTSGG